MSNENKQIHIDDIDARAGSTPHIVRYVLAASLGLAVIVLSVTWIAGALSTG